MKKFWSLLFVLTCCVAAQAGISPKPEMEFTLIYQTQNRPLIRPTTSEQIQCSDNQCLQSAPLGQYGLQKLYCKPDGCFSIAYEYEPFQQLILDFDDGVKRTSNVFEVPRKLRNNFHVLVRPTDLQVELSPYEKHFNALLRADAWLSLIIILLLELLAAWSYLHYTRKTYRILYGVVLVNLITMPLSWQVLAKWVTEPWCLWLSCFVFEILFFWIVYRKRLSLRDAFNLSFAVNVTSYAAGMILSFVLTPYLF